MITVVQEMVRQDASQDEAKERERERLIARLLAAYAFTQADIHRLSTLLCASYLAAMQRSARLALATVGASVTWRPTTQQGKEAAEQAMQAARSIAATFSSLLEGFLRRSGAMLDDLHATLAGIVSWFHQMLTWKVPQIVNATIQSGKQAGTSEIVQQILVGTIVSEDDPDLVVGADGYEIEVVPAEASNDLCAQYAGQRFPLADYDLLPDWPLHGSCPHENVLVPLAA